MHFTGATSAAQCSWTSKRRFALTCNTRLTILKRKKPLTTTWRKLRVIQPRRAISNSLLTSTMKNHSFGRSMTPNQALSALSLFTVPFSDQLSASSPFFANMWVESGRSLYRLDRSSSAQSRKTSCHTLRRCTCVCTEKASESRSTAPTTASTRRCETLSLLSSITSSLLVNTKKS